VIRANCVTASYRSGHLLESYQFEIGPLPLAVTRRVLAVMHSEQPVRDPRGRIWLVRGRISACGEISGTLVSATLMHYTHDTAREDA
jgi:hypothetical protein